MIPESAIFFGRIKNRKIFVLGNIKVICSVKSIDKVL